MTDRAEILIPDATYHVYNRAHGNEKLFKSPENYRYFLEKYRGCISPLADTFCYCLMPNHFHFLIRCKAEKTIEEHFLSSKTTTLTGLRSESLTLSGLGFAEKQKMLSRHITLQFSHLFNSYTQAFNKQNARKGGLFMTPYNRIRVNDLHYLHTLVKYIHLNPVNSGFCRNPVDWKYSSYESILKQNNSFVAASEVIRWFADIDNFKYLHQTQA